MNTEWNNAHPSPENPKYKWADHGKKTSVHKLASPEINWDIGAHTNFYNNCYW